MAGAHSYMNRLYLICLTFIVSSVHAGDNLAPIPNAGTQFKSTPSLALGSASCAFGAPPATLSLLQAIERALCFDPASREAWSTIRDRQAQLATSQAAYLPDVDLSAADGIKRDVGSTPSAPLYNENAKFRDPKDELTVAFTVFDFGLRQATELSAKEALKSAYASHDDTIRTIVLETAKAYYDLARSQDRVSADRDTEAYMRELNEIADGRYRGGAALITEKLQAASDYEDAIFKRVGAEGDVLVAKGTLASLMGARPDLEFAIIDDAKPETDAELSESFDWLVRRAIQNDPKVRACNANLLTAEADLRAERVRYMPTVSIVGSLSHSAQRFIGLPELPLFQNGTDNSTRTGEIGLQLTVPISASFTRSDRVASARAAVASAASELDAAVQQSSLEVWSQYQKMHVAEKSVESAQHMVDLGIDILASARGRYEAGAGSLADAVNAQKQLESSRLKHSEALLDLRIARLSLLSGIGSLNLFVAQ